MKQFSIALLMLVSAVLFGYDFYVVNSESQTLSSVDTESGIIDPDFAVLSNAPYAAPNYMAILDDTAYVTVTYENRLEVVELSSNRVRNSIYLGDNVLPYGVCSGEGYLWVTGSGDNHLYQIDLESEEVVNSIATGTYPQSLLYFDGKIYVSNTGFNPSNYSYSPGTVSVFDASDCSLITTIDTDLNPQSMAVYNDMIHLSCTGNYIDVAGKIDLIDPQTNVVTETLNLGGTPKSIACFEDGRMFVGNAWPAGVYVYNAETLDVLVEPNDGIFLGGNALTIYNGELLSVDAGDYISNSDVYRYELENDSLLNTYEVAVGATDVVVKVETSSIQDEGIEPNLPIALQAWPNPARYGSSISFSLPEGTNADRYIIYDVRGRRIANVHGNTWDGRDVNGKQTGSGIYFCAAMNESKTLSVRKITIVR